MKRDGWKCFWERKEFFLFLVIFWYKFGNVLKMELKLLVGRLLRNIDSCGGGGDFGLLISVMWYVFFIVWYKFLIMDSEFGLEE